MATEADISETQMLLNYGEQVCMNLLKDHTTQKNIYWATDSYAERGEGYTFHDYITIDKITGDNNKLIRPRAVKTKEEQTQRVKDKAEVFTPAWICNAQNNLVDEAWFGRTEGLFNYPDPNNPQAWINNEEKIVFTEDKTWKEYVADVRLEMTCGEAPYLANRYDVVTGEFNQIAKYRIGMLDRKLRIVSENAKDSKEWILWAKIALRATYGFEWQGDNLLLAREALFFTFVEHYIEQFGEDKFNQNKMRIMPGVAYIISWNIWQMDGMTFGLPGHEEDIKRRLTRIESYNLELKKFEEKQEQLETLMNNSLLIAEQQGLAIPKRPQLEPEGPFEGYCLIKDFFHGVNLKKATLTTQDFHDKDAPKQTFASLLNRN